MNPLFASNFSPPGQFERVLHLDETRAVEPLARISLIEPKYDIGDEQNRS